MARTGLRMMPTFPSSPLKFRAAGFPRHGFKASLSDNAFLHRCVVKRAPRMPTPRCSLRCPSPESAPEHVPGSESRLVRASPGRCARGPASLPQGSLAPVRVMLSRSLIAYYDPIRQSRRHAATSRPCRLYAAPSLCGSAEATRETFPTFTAVLSTRAADPTPVGPARSPVVYARGYQAASDYQRVATHKCPSLPAMLDGVMHFGAASFASCYGSCVCPALLTGYDEVKSAALHSAF
jgi:hypothetical protein